MLSTLVTIPEMSTILSETADVSNPWFVQFLPFAYFAIAIFMGVLALGFIVSLVQSIVDRKDDVYRVAPPQYRPRTDFERTRELYNFNRTGKWGNYN